MPKMDESDDSNDSILLSQKKLFVTPPKYKLAIFYISFAVIIANSALDIVRYTAEPTNRTIMTLCTQTIFFQIQAALFLSAMICAQDTRFLILCLICTILPAGILALMPFPIFAGANPDTDPNNLNMDFLTFGVTTYTYIAANAAGLALGVRRALTTDILYITEISIYLTFSFLAVQIWSFVDKFATLYVIAWNLTHFTKIYAVRAKYIWLWWICNIMYVAVAAVAVFGFTRLSSDIAKNIEEIAMTYIVLVISSIIRAAFVRYLVSGLTELLLINLKCI